MMIQYTPDEFSEIMDFNDAMSEFIESMESGTPVMALHIGQKNELEERKKELQLTDRLNKLEKRLNDIQGENVKSDILIIPTKDQISNFIKKDGKQ